MPGSSPQFATYQVLGLKKLMKIKYLQYCKMCAQNRINIILISLTLPVGSYVMYVLSGTGGRWRLSIASVFCSTYHMYLPTYVRSRRAGETLVSVHCAYDVGMYNICLVARRNDIIFFSYFAIKSDYHFNCNFTQVLFLLILRLN